MFWVIQTPEIKAKIRTVRTKARKRCEVEDDRIYINPPGNAATKETNNQNIAGYKDRKIIRTKESVNACWYTDQDPGCSKSAQSAVSRSRTKSADAAHQHGTPG